MVYARLIGESMKDTGEQFAKYLNDSSKVSEMASMSNDYIGATLGVGNSIDSLNLEKSPQ